MTVTDLTGRKAKRRRAALLVAVFFVIPVLAAIYEGGYILECEYPFWPTLWMAKQTKIPDGLRVTDLISTRSGDSFKDQHWRHCTWCDVVYPHAPHMAVKVMINEEESNFYLFDWDLTRRKLLPITVRTAKLFPELIPSGYTVQLSGVGLNPQLYNNDEPCRIVAAVPSNATRADQRTTR
jgi:hypothetical protein